MIQKGTTPLHVFNPRASSRDYPISGIADPNPVSRMRSRAVSGPNYDPIRIFNQGLQDGENSIYFPGNSQQSDVYGKKTSHLASWVGQEVSLDFEYRSKPGHFNGYVATVQVNTEDKNIMFLIRDQNSESTVSLASLVKNQDLVGLSIKLEKKPETVKK